MYISELDFSELLFKCRNAALYHLLKLENFRSALILGYIAELIKHIKITIYSHCITGFFVKRHWKILRLCC